MSRHRRGLPRKARKPFWALLTVALICAMISPLVKMSFADAATGDYGYPGPSYSGAGTAPTADKPQSKLWFNDGLWWADMFDTVSKTWHIFKLNRATEVWQDTGVAIDNRPATRGDALWDGTHLYVASNVLASSSTANVSGQPARLYRYSYSTASKTYTRDTGFPVNINNYSSESITLDKDSRGTLWATWTQGQKVYVNSTTGSDSTWGTPFAISATGASGMSGDDLSALAAYGKNKIGLMWSNQNTSTFYFAVHRDGDARTTWTTKAAISDPGVADDHIDLKQLEGDDQGHLYAAVKTSKDSTGVSTAAQNLLLGLNVASGTWDTAVFGTVADCHTRPMIVIDSTNRVLHMFATGPSTTTGCPGSGTAGTIYEKTTSLDKLSFPTGRGTPVIRDVASANMNNVTGTKQNITSTTGMVVMASNDATLRYWHADVPLGGTTAPTVTFTASATTGTAPLPVTFTDTSTGLTAWSWNFGDGTAATTKTATHTYTSAGTYTVTLTGTGPGGTATASKTITVSAPPTQGKTVTYGGGTSTGQSTTGTALTLSTPAGTAAGNLLIASFTTDAAPNVTAPAGWTPLVTLRPSGASVFAYYHVVTAADASTSTWKFTLSSAVKWSGGMTRYVDVNTTTPIDATAKTVVSAGASSLSVPALTTTTAGAMLVGGVGADSGRVTATPPAGFTEAFENGLGQLAEAGYASTTAVGSQGAKTFTISAAMPSAAWTVALRPAP